MAKKIIQGLEWIPFIIGIIAGIFNLAFWIVYVIVLLVGNHKPHQLLLKMFYIWGVLTIIVAIIAALFGFLLYILI